MAPTSARQTTWGGGCSRAGWLAASCGKPWVPSTAASRRDFELLLNSFKFPMPPKRSARGGAKGKTFKTAPKPGRNRRAQMKAERAALVAAGELDEDAPKSFDERAATSGPGGAKADKRRRKAKVRGDTKRSKRSAMDTYYMVVDGELDTSRPFNGKPCGGASQQSAVEAAVRIAKKAWSQNKKMDVVTVEHHESGTRYSFDPRQWCDANGKAKFGEPGQVVTPIRIGVPGASVSQRGGGRRGSSGRRANKAGVGVGAGRTGLTPRLRALAVPENDMSDAARLKAST